MQIEVGKVYKCGNNLVKIMYFSQEHRDRSFYDYVGCKVSLSGNVSCQTGMFNRNGDYCTGNPTDLQDELEELISPEKQSKLDKIAVMEEQLKQLKEEVNNE